MKSKNKFRMTAYTGAVIQHLFWGKFIIDLAGLRTPPGKLPALREHDRLRAVGVIDKKTKYIKTLIADGYFLNNADGRECQALIKEGFPMQASLGVFFKKIEKLDKKETVIVNGGAFTGPGVVIRESYVREVSFVALGADGNTSVSNMNFKRSKTVTENKSEPTDFNAALEVYLTQGKPIDESIKLAVENYPEQYEAYCDELMQPYLDSLA